MTSITPSPEMVERASEAMWREEATGIPALERARLLEKFSELHPAAQAKYRRIATACLTAALSCPDGFKLVPAHLTDEMVEAAFESGYEGTEDHLRKDYRAMLAASPAPSQDAPPPRSLSNKD